MRASHLKDFSKVPGPNRIQLTGSAAKKIEKKRGCLLRAKTCHHGETKKRAKTNHKSAKQYTMVLIEVERDILPAKEQI